MKLIERMLYRWKVKVTEVEGGPIIERDFNCYWNPEREDAEEAVKNAAAAMESVRAGKRYHAVGAELLTA